MLSARCMMRKPGSGEVKMAVRTEKTSRSKISLKVKTSRKKSPAPKAPPPAAEVTGKGAPTAEQEAYWKAFHEMLEKSSEIVEWKVSRTLEEAKALSVNEDFQQAVAEIRQRYGIEPRIQSKLVDPGAVLHEYTSHLDEAGREKLENDLSALAKRFDLAWSNEGEDYGLIVGALCYGLTPEILTGHWEEIRYSMARTRTPGVKLMLDTGQNLKEKLADQIVISYLIMLLRENGIPVSLPEPIREIVREALSRVGRIGLSAERAAEAISSIQEKFLTPELYIRVVRNTTLEDIKRTWPQVEMRKVEWLRGEGGRRTSPRRGRTWRTYERDIYVWRRVNRGGLTYENAYDAWLRDHPEDPAVELSAVIRSVRRIKFVPEEVPEINSAD
jgi:hypothetical protein